MSTAKTIAVSLLVSCLLGACADGDTKPQPGGGDSRVQQRDSAWWLDGGVEPDLGLPGDGPRGDSPQIAGDGARPDLPTGSAAADDVCPPTTPAITSDQRLQGQTSQQSISGACGQTQPYSQAVAVVLAERRRVEVTVTCDASLTVLSVRTGCSGLGCKAGDAKNGMTYVTTAKEPGTYNIVVGTSTAASYILEVRLLPP